MKNGILEADWRACGQVTKRPSTELLDGSDKTRNVTGCPPMNGFGWGNVGVTNEYCSQLTPFSTTNPTFGLLGLK